MDATDYFECLGFYASPNVNLADFFMDVIGGTVARNNDPGFTSADLFSFWKDWVVHANKPYFELEEEEGTAASSGGGNGGNRKQFERQSTGANQHNTTHSSSTYTFKPNQIEIVRRLFVEAMVIPGGAAERASFDASPSIKKEKDLHSFLRLVSQATMVGSITTHQSLALGLVVRTLFWVDGMTGHSLKQSMSQGSMGEMLKNMGEISQKTQKTNQSLQEIELSDQNATNVTSSSNGNGRVGVLNYSDLMFALSDGEILSEMMNIRLSQLMGRTASLNNNGADQKIPSSRPTHTIRERRFGCDYIFAQFVLYATRYALKRRRQFTTWLTELILFIFGAFLIGVITGP